MNTDYHAPLAHSSHFHHGGRQPVALAGSAGSPPVRSRDMGSPARRMVPPARTGTFVRAAALLSVTLVPGADAGFPHDRIEPEADNRRTSSCAANGVLSPQPSHWMARRSPSPSTGWSSSALSCATPRDACCDPERITWEILVRMPENWAYLPAAAHPLGAWSASPGPRQGRASSTVLNLTAIPRTLLSTPQQRGVADR